jgi:hypothetical protein
MPSSSFYINFRLTINFKVGIIITHKQENIMELKVIANPVTTYGKDDNGCWADTVLATIGDLTLVIHTSKNTSKGTLDTRASCRKIEAHSYTVRLFQDFSSVVDREKVRCTEKAVKAQHAHSLTHAQDTIDGAYHHYTCPEYFARYGKQ